MQHLSATSELAANSARAPWQGLRAFFVRAFAVLACALVPACGGDESGTGPASCGPGDWEGAYGGRTSDIAGTAYTIRANITGSTISFWLFYCSCRGSYPDGGHCGVDVQGFEPAVTTEISSGCEFAIRAQDGAVEMHVDGALEADGMIRGTYRLDYGTCCSDSGRWWARKLEGRGAYVPGSRDGEVWQK